MTVKHLKITTKSYPDLPNKEMDKDSLTQVSAIDPIQLMDLAIFLNGERVTANEISIDMVAGDTPTKGYIEVTGDGSITSISTGTPIVIPPYGEVKPLEDITSGIYPLLPFDLKVDGMGSDLVEGEPSKGYDYTAVIGGQRINPTSIKIRCKDSKPISAILEIPLSVLQLNINMEVVTKPTPEVIVKGIPIKE